MSRPPTKNRDSIRRSQILIRVTTNQKQRWKDKAARLGISLSQWIRMLADRDARM